MDQPVCKYCCPGGWFAWGSSQPPTHCPYCKRELSCESELASKNKIIQQLEKENERLMGCFLREDLRKQLVIALRILDKIDNGESGWGNDIKRLLKETRNEADALWEEMIERDKTVCDLKQQLASLREENKELRKDLLSRTASNNRKIADLEQQLAEYKALICEHKIPINKYCSVCSKKGLDDNYKYTKALEQRNAELVELFSEEKIIEIIQDLSYLFYNDFKGDCHIIAKTIADKAQAIITEEK